MGSIRRYYPPYNMEVQSYHEENGSENFYYFRFSQFGQYIYVQPFLNVLL
jgi:hypothetical protein